LQQVKNSAEAFPICVSPFSLSVHYTEISQEVNGLDNQLYDVSSDLPGLNEVVQTIKSTDLKVSPVIKVSVSFDVAKVDELAAL
jgi:hypothetical protein